MSKRVNALRVGFVFLPLLVASLLVLPHKVLADAPPLPCRFYGQLPESDANTLVSAHLDGVEQAVATSFLDGGQSVYVIDVPGDDPSTVEVEGAVEGASITFRLDGVDGVQTLLWSSGQAVFGPLQPVAVAGGPVAADLSFSSLEDVPLALQLTATDPDHQPLTYSVVSGPAHGTLVGTPPDLVYHPTADWNGSDGFTFEASDGTASDLGTVSLTVDAVPDPPRLDAIPNLSLAAGDSLEVPVLASDADGHVITFQALGLPSFTAFNITGNGTALLSVAPGFSDVGLYSGLRIVARDGSFSDEILFSLQVTTASGPPVAYDQTSSTAEDTALPLTLDAVDPDGDAITFAVTVPPSHGVLSGQPPQLVYTPHADFFGDDAFTFAASDGSGTSAPGTVSLSVEPVADAPILEPLAALAIDEGVFLELPILAGDADGDPLSLSANGLPSFATFEDLGAGVGRLILAPGFEDAGTYADLEIQVSDGVLSDSQIFTLTVDDFEAPPVVAFRPSDGLNAARLGEATVASYSSHRSSSIPERAIDSIANTAWSADGTAAQWLRVRLVGGVSHVVDRVVLRGRGTNSGLRNFEIRVSTTGSNAADFITVLSAELPQDNTDHAFDLPSPVQARFVELYAVDNWGNTVATDVFNFEIHSRPRQGGVVSLIGAGASVAEVSSVGQDAERAFDLDDISRWQSANGAGTDQWLTVDLAGDAPWIIDQVRLVAPSINSSPQNFEIRVSDSGLEALDFTTVFQGTLRQGGGPHWFLFDAVTARYVQLYVHDTYGLNWVGVASFDVYSPDIGGPAVAFDDHSFDPDGQTVAWDWDFGDGTTSVERHPEHIYAAPGTYPVTLQVTDDQGQTSQAQHSYTVLETPQAAFSWTPQTTDEGDAVHFTDLSTAPSGSLLAWRWTFHEGSVRTADDPTWVYRDNGAFPVSLEITDGRGLTAAVSQPVTVDNVAPSIVLIPGPSTVWGQPWALGQASVTDPGADDHPTLHCTWDFGDGESEEIPFCYGTESRIEHTWQVPGTYSTSLTAVDDDGGSVVATLDHQVLQRPSRVTLLAENALLETAELALTARLIDDFEDGVLLAGRTVTFRRGAQAVDAVTDANGEASADLVLVPEDPDPVIVEFAGDALYLGDSGQQLAPGVVLAGIGDGMVHVYTAQGELVERLDTGSDSQEQTGMCLDSTGLLYTTNFATFPGGSIANVYGSSSRFDRWGNRLDSMWTGPYDPHPESCVIDPAGNVLIAAVDANAGEDTLFVYGPDGGLMASYRPEEDRRGVDWIDLAADGCTLLYTSEGTRVLRFDVCTGQQLADFADGLESPLYALRLRRNGEVMVASSDLIYRLDANGQVMQTYFGPSGDYFALNLDPDGTSFWTAYYGLGTVFRVDIESGEVLTSFTAGPLPRALSGLAIVGEPTAANNYPPIADAGPDGTANLGDSVALDGSASMDPDVGDVLTFAWLQTAGPGIVIDDTTSPTTSFVASEVGTYSFELTVSDGARSASDTVTMVIDEAPAAAACAVAPFTIDWSVLNGVGLGQVAVDVPRGITNGHFGWLSWSGAEDAVTLATSLTPPGDSHTYVHPADPSDTELSPGDWVYALGDQVDEQVLQDALFALTGQDIIVPIWNYHYQGPTYQKFRIGAFVQLRVVGHGLDGDDRLSLQYFGEVQCPPVP